MTLDARRDRTELRLKLYENGFTPLANKSKMCLIPQWSTLEVTPELIQSPAWARSRKFQDTGLRCGDIVALDWDIDDADLLNELLDKIVEQGIVEESPFVRVGMPPRELWVYRTKEKIGKRTTGHFMPPNPPDDHKGFAVEVLGSGCQFAAYGQRDETTAYRWPERSLLDAQYMDLPPITKAQAEAVRDFCSLFFELHGLERRSPAGGTDSGYTHAYDLTADMVFDVYDMGPMSVAEIGEALKAAPEGEVLRCKVDALRPTTGSWAGMISLAGGDVCLSDHGTYTSHFPVEADTDRKLYELGVKLAERFPMAAPPPLADLSMDPHRPLDDNLAAALQRFVYVVSDGCVCDLANGFSTEPIRNFRDNMGPYKEVKPGPQGGEEVSRLSELWRDDPRRLTARTMQMRPDRPRPTYWEDGAMHVNTYEPVEHSSIGGDAKVGLAFIEHLLPVDAERSYFMQWLSYKVQHPHVPGPAIVMVARDSYGTGRGTMSKLLGEIFGARYVEPVDFLTLTGQGSQSQYNEWLSDSLVVVVDEAKESTGTLTSWQTRSNAYEHLKSVIDPAGRGVHIKRKGVKNSKAMTFASVVINSNHADAFILPANDRRIAVLENGPSMPGEYWQRVYDWMAVPANVGALVAELLRVDLSSYNPYAAPPMTASKADMVDAGASELDRAVAFAMDGIANTLIVKEQIILRVEDYLAESNVEVPDDWRRLIERMVFRKTRGVLPGMQERVRIEKKQRVVRMVGRVAEEATKSSEAMIAEVLRNGPVVREIKTSGSVVNFRRG